jgi:hypothetical protein
LSASEIQFAIALTKDFVSVLVPVITGFLVIYTAALGKLWSDHRGLFSTIRIWIAAGAPAIAGIVSLFCCFGVIQILLNLAGPEPHSTIWFGKLNQTEMLQYARRYLIIGQLIFGVAVGLAIGFYIHVFRKGT